MSIKYYKITNKHEIHHGYQYHDGLNVLDRDFEPHGHCVAGGLYFATGANICRYLHFGCNIREVTLPTHHEKFQMVADGKKFRASMIVLGPKRCLTDIATIDYLDSIGADTICLFYWCIRFNVRAIIDYFVQNRLNNETRQECLDRALRHSIRANNIDLMQYFVNLGADIQNNSLVLTKLAIGTNNVSVMEYLVSMGLDISAGKHNGLWYCAAVNKIEMAQYLVRMGADPTFKRHIPIRTAASRGHIDMVKYFISICDNHKLYAKLALCNAVAYRQTHLVEYLLSTNMVTQSLFCLRIAIRHADINMVKILVKNMDNIEYCLKILNEYPNDEIAQYLNYKKISMAADHNLWP